MVGWLSKILQGDRSKARRREEHDDLRGSEKTKESTLVSVDDLTFDTTGFEFGKEHPTTRAWRNSAGDTVIVILQNSSPIYPVDANNISELFDGIRTACIANGNGIVEQYLANLNEYLAYLHILRVIEEGRAVGYQAYLSIPFREYHFELLIVCKEWGETGVRESMAMADAHFEGRIKLGEDGTFSVEGDVNSDDRKYDQMFPNHPLSRCRKLVKHVSSTISTSEKLAKLDQYKWPIGES